MAKILEVKLRSLSKFRKLLQLEAKKKEIEEEIAEIKEELIPVVKSLDEVECDGCKFSVMRRAKWKFSAKVAELKGRLKAQQEYEMENHIARRVNPTEYIKITK